MLVLTPSGFFLTVAMLAEGVGPRGHEGRDLLHEINLKSLRYLSNRFFYLNNNQLLIYHEINFLQTFFNIFLFLPG